MSEWLVRPDEREEVKVSFFDQDDDTGPAIAADVDWGARGNTKGGGGGGPPHHRVAAGDHRRAAARAQDLTPFCVLVANLGVFLIGTPLRGRTTDTVPTARCTHVLRVAALRILQPDDAARRLKAAKSASPL